MAAPRRWALVALAVLAGGLVLASVLAGPPLDGPPHTTTVTVAAENGTTLGTLAVTVADTPLERYRGLSGTEPLGPTEGMLFVFAEEAPRTFVMRGMTYPLDIVFVGADGRITAIRHAPVPAAGEDLRRYTGEAKWVLEVRRGWTTAHGVTVGDRVRIGG